LALEVHRVTKQFPREELYGLVSQTRRAAVSVPTNIAEGCGRGGRLQFRHFLTNSAGSASELEYLLFLSYELKYMDLETWTRLNDQVIEVNRMLSGLIHKLSSETED
jgi:four helix bundle protein